MIKKISVFFLFCLLSSCSFVFDSVTTYEPKEEPSYNVAVLLPLSGKYKEIGESLLNTIHLTYAQNTNKYIVLKIYDINKFSTSQEISTKILQDNNKAVIGPLFGNKALELAKLLEKQNIPVFTFSNDITIIGKTSNLYTLSPLPGSEIESSIDYASKNLNSKRFAVLVPDNKYGDILKVSISKSLNDRNLKLVKVISYPTSTPRLMPYIQRLLTNKDLYRYQDINKKLANKEKVLDKNGNEITKLPEASLNFDTLIFADFGPRVSIVTSHFPSLGINTSSLKIIGLSNWENPEVYANSLLQNAYFSTLNNFSDTKFAKDYQKYYGKNLSPLDVTAYDTVITIMSLVYKDTDGNLVNNFTNDNITSIKLKGLAGNFIITKDYTSRRNMSIKKISKEKGEAILIKENINLNEFVKNYNYQSLQFKDE